MSSIKRKVDATIAKDASSSPSSKTSKTHEAGNSSSTVAGKLKTDGDDDDASNNDDSSNEMTRDESIDLYETSSDHEEEDEEEEEEEETIRNVKTCSNCHHFCASWTQHFARGATGISCEMTSHHGRRYDPYLDAAPCNNTTTATKIGMASQGCTVDQRVAFLCSLYKLSKTSEDFRIFADPQFLQLNFKDLIHEPKVIRVALLYGCHKLLPEALVLARNCGVAELEEKFGKLKAYEYPFWYQNHEAHVDDNPNEGENALPSAVEEIDADGDAHFSLSGEQWTKLRRTYGGPSSCCENNMSIFTYYNRTSVDVKSILGSLHIV